MKAEKEKMCQMSNGILIVPASWQEINPRAAIHSKHIAICSDEQNRTALYFLKKSLDQLSTKEVASIISQARAIGLGADTSIYGYIENEKYNKSGAKFIKKQEG